MAEVGRVDPRPVEPSKNKPNASNTIDRQYDRCEQSETDSHLGKDARRHAIYWTMHMMLLLKDGKKRKKGKKAAKVRLVMVCRWLAPR